MKAKRSAGESLTIRVPPDLRGNVQAIADRNGVSLNQQIRNILERFLRDDQKICKRFGGRREYSFWRLLSIVAQETSDERGGRLGNIDAWLDDWHRFRQAETAARIVFAALRPTGPPRDSSELEAERGKMAELAGLWSAARILKDLKSRPEDLSKGESYIREDMANLVERLPEDLLEDERIKSSLLGTSK